MGNNDMMGIIKKQEHEVVFSYGQISVTVIVKDEEDMNEDEIVAEAQAIMQREVLAINTEQIDDFLVQCRKRDDK